MAAAWVAVITIVLRLLVCSRAPCVGVCTLRTPMRHDRDGDPCKMRERGQTATVVRVTVSAGGGGFPAVESYGAGEGVRR